VVLSFAGGLLRVGPARAPATALVVRTAGRTLRFVPPSALVRATVGEGLWEVRAWGPAWRARVEADAADTGLLLPVPPEGGPRAPTPRAPVRQHQEGRLRLRLWYRRRLVYSGDTGRAALELGG
jgi:hypothetical protein